MRELINIVEDVYDDEEETPEERARDEESLRVRTLEQKIQAFCEKTLNWSFDVHSYAIIYDSTEGEITIVPDNEEVTLEELSKLSLLGDAIRISSSSKPYALSITIKAHPGLNISTN